MKQELLDEDFQDMLIRKSPWYQSVRAKAASDEAIKAFCTTVRPVRKGCVTRTQQRLLYPLARHLLDAGRTVTAVGDLTNLGRRALRVVRNLKFKDGAFVFPPRKTRSDSRPADEEEAKQWWIDNARTDPGVKTTVVDPSVHVRRKGQRATVE